MSGLALPARRRNNSPCLWFPIFETSATALWDTTRKDVFDLLDIFMFVHIILSRRKKPVLSLRETPGYLQRHQHQAPHPAAAQACRLESTRGRWHLAAAHPAAAPAPKLQSPRCFLQRQQHPDQHASSNTAERHLAAARCRGTSTKLQSASCHKHLAAVPCSCTSTKTHAAIDILQRHPAPAPKLQSEHAKLFLYFK